MTSNSTFISISSEGRWILEIDKNFPKEQVVDIDFDTPTCVFRVPKSLSETKPEAYAPQHLGLGPYHHLRPEFYKMQKQKFSAVRKFLNQEKLQDFNRAVEALIQWEPVVRACYDQYLDFDIRTLARILVIDALYLRQLLVTSRESGGLTEIDEFGVPIITLESQNPKIKKFAGDIATLENQTPGMKKFAGDIMMLENQMPLILLEKIQQVLQLEETVEQDALFRELIQLFCQTYSPLKWNQQQQIPEDMTQLHLLHHLYYLIVTNRGHVIEMSAMSVMLPMTALGGLIAVFRFLAARRMHGAEAVVKALTFILKLPMDTILALFKKGGPGEQIPSVEKIDIPTVSQMSGTAGIKFKSTHKGIRDIEYVDRKNGKIMLFLPSIRLDANSEVILRNLVAYEAASAKPGSTLELAEYVDLMCGIIDTTKDVQILKDAEIIEGELPDEEIVRIFNGINKSTKRNDKKSNIENAIDNINERYHGLVRVKVKKFLKKHFYVLLKFLSVLITVAVVVVLTLEAFCSVFGCGRWFGKGTTLQIHNLLFLDQ